MELNADFTKRAVVHGAFQPYSWLRLPPNSRLLAQSGSEGCQIWLKQL
jgi:hypothetical protein